MSLKRAMATDSDLLEDDERTGIESVIHDLEASMGGLIRQPFKI